MRHGEVTTHRLGICVPEAEVQAMGVRVVEEQPEMVVAQVEELRGEAVPDGTGGRLTVNAAA